MSLGALWRRMSAGPDGTAADAEPPVVGGGGSAATRQVTLLVIDADKKHNWKEVFDGCTVSLPPPRPPRAPRPAGGAGGAAASGAHTPAAPSTAATTASAATDADGRAGDAGTTPSSGGDARSAEDEGAGGGGAAEAVDAPGAPAASVGGAGARAGGAAAVSDAAGGEADVAGSVADEARARVVCTLRVVQTGWEGINLASYTSSGCVVDVLPVFDGERRRTRGFCIKPDFVLVRNEVRGVTAAQDKRNLLYGMQYAGVQSLNSLESIVMFLERPLIHAHLAGIQRRLGAEAFPLVDQTYYPDHRAMLISPSFPCVVKVGHAHAGYGKIVMRDHHQFADMASVMAVTGSYCTAEPFIEADYDVRIQKLGTSYRAFQRRSMSGNWKTNTGTSIVEEIPVTDQYRTWADAAATAFGGLDIVTVDAIHSIEDDVEYILEMNGTSSGLMPEREEEDHVVIRDMVLAKMEATLSAPAR